MPARSRASRPVEVKAEPARAANGTLGRLALDYFASPAFRRLDPVTQRRRRAIIEGCLLEPRKLTAAGKPDGQDIFRDCPLSALTAAHVRVLRDRKGELAGAANNRLKVVSAMFAWANENGHILTNPARDVKKIKYATDGWHTWSVDEVRCYIKRHPIGTKAYLALALMMFTGARRSDVVKLGRPHLRDGWIRFVATKTRKVRAARMRSRSSRRCRLLLTRARWGAHVPGHRVPPPLHGSGIRRLVSGPLRRGRPATVHSARTPKGRRDDRCGKWGD